MNMRVRKFKKEDAIKVSNIIRRCFREVNSKDYSEKVIINLCNFFTPSLLIKNLKDKAIFVAVKNNKTIGTASLKENVIMTVFVNPDFIGKGVGSKLMDRVENLARKREYKTVMVPSGLTSVEFYKKRGYKKVEIIRSKDHGNTIKMEKKL